MACLTSLGIGALDGEETMGEIDGFPSEFQEFTSPKSRVYGKENRGRYMVPEVRERRKDFPAALASPDIGGLASHPHLCIAHLQGLTNGAQQWQLFISRARWYCNCFWWR